jgi:hypothetical protein
MEQYLKTSTSLGDIDYAKMQEDFYNSDIGKGYYTKKDDGTYELKDATLAEEANTALVNYFDTFFESTEEGAKAVEETLSAFSEDTTQTIENLYSQFSTSAKNELDRINLIKELNVNDAIKDALYQLQEDNIETYNENIQALADYTGEGLAEGEGGIKIGAGQFTKMFEQWSTAAQSSIISMMSNFSENKKTWFLQGLTDLGLDDNDISEALEFDWSSVTLFNKDEMKEQFIDALPSNYTNQEKQEIANKVFGFMDNLGEMATIPTSFEDYKSQLESWISDTASNYSSAISAYKSAATSQIENGYVDYDSLSSLQSSLSEIGLNVSDYVDANLQLDTDALKASLEEQITNQASVNDEVKTEIENRIADLKLMKSQAESIGKQVKYQTLLNKITMNAEDYQDVAQVQAELDLITTDNSVDTSAIDDQIEYYTEYLEQLDSDDTVKAQELLATALYQQVESTADEIADTVEDKSDEIEDALEAIEEAEQDVIDKTKELQEAYQGSDWYKSAVD